MLIDWTRTPLAAAAPPAASLTVAVNDAALLPQVHNGKMFVPVEIKSGMVSANAACRLQPVALVVAVQRLSLRLSRMLSSAAAAAAAMSGRSQVW
jgi:hypothetical protein